MKINVLKEGAQVDIKITPPHLHRLQQLMMLAIRDIPEEDMLKMNNILTEAEQKRDPKILDKLEEWAHPIIFIISFIQEIESKAIEQGLTYEKEVDDPIQPDSSLPDLSQ